MTTALEFDQIRLPPECDELRHEVRAFLADEVARGTFDPHRPGHGDSHSKEFSQRIGAKGWIGMTWPKKYGGRERNFLERYVVTEEFRVANAPVRLHFVADRQSGPILMKYAPEHVKMDVLPRICAGEVCFAIGMSEPGSGSDLFAAKTKATKTNGGWLINGTKIWTSNAHIADYMIALFRTSPPTKENRRHGLTQFLVDMKTPGITVNPVYQLTGMHDFNEVVFQDAFMPDDHVLGEIDGAWKQATSELAYERSGPERFLETFYVLVELVRALGDKPDVRSAEGLGPPRRAAAHAAPHVGLGERHAAGRQGAGGGRLDREGHGHGVGAEAAEPRARAQRLHRGDRRQPRHAGGAASLRHHDRAQAHHPGRDHRSAARHHRARAGPALMECSFAPLVPAKAGTQGPQGRKNWIPASAGMSGVFGA